MTFENNNVKGVSLLSGDRHFTGVFQFTTNSNPKSGGTKDVTSRYFMEFSSSAFSASSAGGGKPNVNYAYDYDTWGTKYVWSDTTSYGGSMVNQYGMFQVNTTNGKSGCAQLTFESYRLDDNSLFDLGYV